MEMLIINIETAEKLRSIEFDGINRLDSIMGEFNGQTVYFLQAELKLNKVFAKALADFEVCKVKEIATIEQKYYDSKGATTTDISKVVTTKTILTEKKLIEPIK